MQMDEWMDGEWEEQVICYISTKLLIIFHNCCLLSEQKMHSVACAIGANTIRYTIYLFSKTIFLKF